MATISSSRTEIDPAKPVYFIYILECANGSYYTGYTKNLARRYAEHQAGTANSRFTRSFKPTRIAQCWQLADTIGTALKIEAWIKRQRKQTKALLIQQPDQLKAMIEHKLRIPAHLTPFDWSAIVPEHSRADRNK